MNKHIETILKVQCDIADIDFEDFKENNFNPYKFSWTITQAIKFNNWFVNYIKDEKVQESLLGVIASRVSDIANNWDMKYGFKIKKR